MILSQSQATMAMTMPTKIATTTTTTTMTTLSSVLLLRIIGILSLVAVPALMMTTTTKLLCLPLPLGEAFSAHQSIAVRRQPLLQ
jgi:hypothetical protein